MCLIVLAPAKASIIGRLEGPPRPPRCSETASMTFRATCAGWLDDEAVVADALSAVAALLSSLTYDRQALGQGQQVAWSRSRMPPKHPAATSTATPHARRPSSSMASRNLIHIRMQPGRPSRTPLILPVSPAEHAACTRLSWPDA
jgi:hypothetical protein